LTDFLKNRFTTSQSHVGIFPYRPLDAYANVRGVDDVEQWKQQAGEHTAPRHLDIRMAPELRRLDPHDHAFCELTLVLGGSARHVTANGERKAERNTAIFVPIGAVHGYEDYRDWHVVHISYLPEWLLDDLNAIRSEDRLLPVFFAPDLFGGCVQATVFQCSLLNEEMAACLVELDSIGEELKSPSPSHLFLKACLHKILVRLARACVRQGHEEAALRLRPEVWLAIDAVEKAVLQGAPFQVADVARTAGLSLSHFSRVFRQDVGRSLQDYYQHRRLQQACKLLLNPDHSITDIALELDFASSSHFSNAFKRHMGASPREYRRRYTGKGVRRRASNDLERG
jgi:AraC-like DNA-binding protein